MYKNLRKIVYVVFFLAVHNFIFQEIKQIRDTNDKVLQSLKKQKVIVNNYEDGLTQIEFYKLLGHLYKLKAFLLDLDLINSIKFRNDLKSGNMNSKNIFEIKKFDLLDDFFKNEITQSKAILTFGIFSNSYMKLLNVYFSVISIIIIKIE
jgi:hypothetical protein